MLVECVPNFSEGRNQEIISGLADILSSQEGCRLLDYSADPDHNRSVFTLAGESEDVAHVLFDAVAYALKNIDMAQHYGIHPRIGAVDVIPFIPLEDTTEEDCIGLAKKFGKRLGEELKIPVYLYEKAATGKHRENLANVRKGEFEGLTEKMKNKDWVPDFGPLKPHPTFGAVAVGVRPFLIAFNINLSTQDVTVAKKIAHTIRFSSGGLPAVKALGIFLKKEGVAQVTINLTDYRVTPLWQVFDLVCREAERYGVAILESELIGLIPQDAIIGCGAHYLKFKNFQTDRILEKRL